MSVLHDKNQNDELNNSNHTEVKNFKEKVIMNFLNKLSPMKVAILVALVLCIITATVVQIFVNSNLEDRMNMIRNGVNREVAGLKNPTVEALTKMIMEYDLDYLALYQGQDEQPYLIAGNDGGSPFSTILPASFMEHIVLDDTPYYADLRLAEREFAPFFIVIITMLFLASLCGSLIVASVLKNRIDLKLGKLRTAISNKDFEQCDDPEIGKMLKSSYTDYDTRIAELQKDNDRLKSLVDTDSLTDVNNRKKFDKDLESILSNKNEASVTLLAMIRATALDHINTTRGFNRGDQYLRDVCKIIFDTVSKFIPNVNKPTHDGKLGPSIYRTKGSDFAILLPNSNMSVAQMLVKELKYAFDIYKNEHEKEIEDVAYTGVVFVRPSQSKELVLSLVDSALSEAQTNSINSGYIKEDYNIGDNKREIIEGEKRWKEIITSIINENAIVLLQQPIQSLNFSVRTYNEIFSRFVNKNGEYYPTETVFAMAQRHEMLASLEMKIIETIIDKYSKNNLTSQRWGINLSINALISVQFVLWLERLLIKYSNITENLVFEISENILDCNIRDSIRLFDMFRRVNVKSCISKFGNGLGSFRLYRELKPDIIKLDPSLVETLERDHSSQLFVRMIVEVSHRLGCIVIAEGVEDYSEKQMLESMYVDGVQGYLIAKPGPLNEGAGTDPVSDTNNQGVGNDNSNAILGG